MKKKKKVAILGLTAVVAITGFIGINYMSHNSFRESNPSESKISAENIEDGKKVYSESYSPLLSVDYSEKNNINNDADYIAIVRIDSLESSNWDSINQKYVAVYSKGKATVLNTIKGDLSDTISYRRLGGKIGYNDWIKGDIDRNKMENVIGKPKNPENVVIESKKDGDIHLEVGKIYLVFMKQYECCNLENEYSIIAYEHGTRELQQTDVSSYSQNSIMSFKVKNNVTGKWESISDVVDFNVSK